MDRPFQPAANKTVNIDVSASSQSKLVTEAITTQVEVHNAGTAVAFIAFGTSAITTAVTTGQPVGAGATCCYTVESADGSPIYVAAIAAGSTGKIYFTPGNGF